MWYHFFYLDFLFFSFDLVPCYDELYDLMDGADAFATDIAINFSRFCISVCLFHLSIVGVGPLFFTSIVSYATFERNGKYYWRSVSLLCCAMHGFLCDLI